MIFNDLSAEDKAKVKELCKDIPELLKEYLNIDELPTIKELQERTAKEFLRYQKCGYTLDYFYKHCDTFLSELSVYASNPGRIQSVIKRLRILKHFGVKRVVDFGSGIGTDPYIYAHFGIKSTQVEFRNRSRRFARWLFQRAGLSKKTRFVEPHKFVSGLSVSKKPYDAIQAIEVVAHVKSPYYLFSMLMKHSNLVIWTNDIGIHRDEHEDPQHLPHDLKLVLNSLDKYGEKCKVEGMAIPPRVWVRR